MIPHVQPPQTEATSPNHRALRAWLTSGAFERWATELGAAAGARLLRVPAVDAVPVVVFGEDVAWIASHGKGAAALSHLTAAGIAAEIEHAELTDYVAKLWRELAFMFEVGSLATQAADETALCRGLLTLAIGAVGAARGSLYLNRGTELVPVAAEGVPEEFLRPIAPADPESIAAWVYRHGTPMVQNDAARRPPSLATHRLEFDAASDSLISLPLCSGRGEPALGTLNLAGKEGGHFTASDLRLLEAVAGRIAEQLEHFRLAKSAIEHAELKQELTLAREIHAGLLPGAMGEVPGFEAAACLQAASDVGGDYYDVIPTATGTYVLIADVSGHGLGAALLVSTVRTTLRAGCRAGLAPGAILAELNEVIADLAGESGLFATAQVILLDGCEATMAAAAHPPALVVEPRSAVRRVHAPGPPAGALPGAEFTEWHFVLEEGETLVLVTDGVLEAGGAGGTRGLERCVSSAPSGAPEALVQHILEWQRAECAVDDDCTIVAIRRAGGTAP